MAEIAQIEFDLHAASIHSEMARLDKELIRVQNSTEDFDAKLNKALRNRKAYAEAQVNLKHLQKELHRTGNAAKNAGGLRGIGFFGQQVGYLVSDSRYGILGMANNLSIIVPQFQNLQKHAKNAGTTLSKEFVKALRGPTGILIALQLLIVLLPEIIEYFKKWAKGSKDVNKATQELVQSETDLQEKIIENNEALEDRIKLQSKQLRRLRNLIRNQKLDSKEGQELIGLLSGLLPEEFRDKNAREQQAIIKQILKDADDVEDAALKIAKGITKLKDDLAVAKITGNLTPSEIAAKELDIFVKTQEALGVKKEDYIKSGKYRILAAKYFQAIFKEDQKVLATLLEEDNVYASAIRSALSSTNGVLSLADVFPDKATEDAEFNEWLEENMPEYIDDVEDAVDTYILNKGKASLTQKLLGLTPDSREKELNELKAKFDPILYATEEFKMAEAAINDKWNKIDRDNAEKTQKFKRDQIQASLQTVTNFLVQAAQLNEENKGLAKAAIIADAAVASIGIWRDYHGSKNTIPAPFNTITAIATTGTLGLATANAIKSIDSNNANANSGGNNSPNFNIIGNTGSNQLEEVINNQTEQLNNKPVKAQVVLAEVNSAAELERKAITQSSLG